MAERDVFAEAVIELRKARGRIMQEIKAIDRAIDALIEYGESTEHDERISELMEEHRNAQ